MTVPVVQLFVNPRPRWYDRRRIAALRRAFEARGLTLVVSESSAARLEIDPRADHVCAVGGDGTLRHVVEAMHRSGLAVPLSVFPVGTVNLLARESGYRVSPEAFVQRVLDRPRNAQHYSAAIGAIPVLTCASVGPDSQVVAILSSTLKDRIGRAAYLVAMLRLLRGWSRTPLTVSCDGATIPCEAVYVAKGRFFAGPWTFAPDAKLIEPWLYVVTIEQATRLHFLRFAWTMLVGGDVAALDGVTRLRCTELSIEGDAAVPLQADGDVVTHLPATITLREAPTRFD